jgi:hypothetical protein
MRTVLDKIHSFALKTRLLEAGTHQCSHQLIVVTINSFTRSRVELVVFVASRRPRREEQETSHYSGRLAS